MLREVGNRSTFVGIVLAVAVGGLAPIVIGTILASDHMLAHPTDFYGLIMRKSGLGLVFPLVVALPYAFALSGQVSQNFLLYTRTRDGIGRTLGARFGASMVVGFTVGFLIALMTYLWAYVAEPLLGLVTYRPGDMGLHTPAAVAADAAGAFTFSQLLPLGSWVFGIGYAVFLGLVGMLYSLATAACLIIMPNRFLALVTPWLVNEALTFAMAVVGLEAVSPNAFMPFNLTQLGLGTPFLPLVALVVATAALVAVVIRRRFTWDTLL
ncbi:MAG: hypothetical protein Q4F67_00525 [Propionibacteriaceae bacterium]|nr:hypothetical protein [Propionibacteriaceae bacterium]